MIWFPRQKEEKSTQFPGSHQRPFFASFSLHLWVICCCGAHPSSCPARNCSVTRCSSASPSVPEAKLRCTAPTTELPPPCRWLNATFATSFFTNCPCQPLKKLSTLCFHLKDFSPMSEADSLNPSWVALPRLHKISPEASSTANTI